MEFQTKVGNILAGILLLPRYLKIVHLWHVQQFHLDRVNKDVLNKKLLVKKIIFHPFYPCDVCVTLISTRHTQISNTLCPRVYLFNLTILQVNINWIKLRDFNKLHKIVGKTKGKGRLTSTPFLNKYATRSAIILRFSAGMSNFARASSVNSLRSVSETCSPGSTIPYEKEYLFKQEIVKFN